MQLSPEARLSKGASRSACSRLRDLLARVVAVCAVTPLLAEHAAVLVVADDPADPARDGDPRLHQALHLLTEAAVSGCGVSVSVDVVVDSCSPADIATTAADRTGGPSSPTTSVANLAADLSYTDWRDEMLSLTMTDDVSYVGWRSPDGHPRVAALRGTVLSPLAVPSGASLSWGDSGSAARQLARTLLAETVGPDARCPACDSQADCPPCGNSGLNDWVRTLADGFVDDVVRHLPAAGFELSTSDLTAWIRRSRFDPAEAGTGARRGPGA